MVAQRVAQVGAAFLSQARIEHAGASDAHARATVAEVFGERRDEADASACLDAIPVACRPAAMVRGTFQRPSFVDRTFEFGERIELVQSFFIADIAHRHDFDVGEVATFFAAPSQQAIDFFGRDIHAFQRDAVDFHRKPCRERSVDSFRDDGKGAAARQVGEGGRVQRIERHIHTTNAACEEFFGELREMRAIGRQRQVSQMSCFFARGDQVAELVQQMHEIFAY